MREWGRYKAAVEGPVGRFGLGIVLVALAATLLIGFLREAQPQFADGRLTGRYVEGLRHGRRTLVCTVTEM